MPMRSAAGRDKQVLLPAGRMLFLLLLRAEVRMRVSAEKSGTGINFPPPFVKGD